MKYNSVLGTLLALMISACATTPPGEPTAAAQENTSARSTSLQPAATSPQLWASKQSRKDSHVWTVPTEEELGKVDRKYMDAAEGFVKLKKDDALMFCKRYRIIGSNIATIQCISEGELRTQVDNMTQYRDAMRGRVGKCVLGKGPDGCSGQK